MAGWPWHPWTQAAHQCWTRLYGKSSVLSKLAPGVCGLGTSQPLGHTCKIFDATDGAAEPVSSRLQGAMEHQGPQSEGPSVHCLRHKVTCLARELPTGCWRKLSWAQGSLSLSRASYCLFWAEHMFPILFYFLIHAYGGGEEDRPSHAVDNCSPRMDGLVEDFLFWFVHQIHFCVRKPIRHLYVPG